VKKGNRLIRKGEASKKKVFPQIKKLLGIAAGRNDDIPWEGKGLWGTVKPPH